jgi:hypothetical protein
MEIQRPEVFMLAERFACPIVPLRGSALSETLEDLIEQKGSEASICLSNKIGVEDYKVDRE